MADSAEPITVYVIDDARSSCRELVHRLKSFGYAAVTFESPRRFLENADFSGTGCVISDLFMPEINGLQLLWELQQRRVFWPVIVISALANVENAVELLQSGALTLLEKPVETERLREAVGRAIEVCRKRRRMLDRLNYIKSRLSLLSAEERDVMNRMLHGVPHKSIAQELDISTRTVDRRRHDIHHTLGVANLADLTRFVVEKDYLVERLRAERCLAPCSTHECS